MNFEEKKVFLVNITFTAVVAFLIFIITRFLLSYLLPFVIGVILAFLMQKPAAALSKKGKLSKPTFAALLVSIAYLFAVCIIGLLVWLTFNFVVKITDSIPQYIKGFQSSFEGIYGKLSRLLERLPSDARETIDGIISETVKTLSSTVLNFFSSFATNLARNLPALLFSSIVTVIASFYIARDFDKIVAFLKNLISTKRYDTILKIKSIVTNSIFKIMVGYLILMGITFAELTVGFWLLGVKNVLIIAALVSIIDLLPVLGTGTILLPWSIICFISSAPIKGIGFVVLYLLVTVIRNVLEPKIIGKQTGINPLLSLITIFVGLRIAGIAGMILLPITVTVVINYYSEQLHEEKTQKTELKN